ncbi:hypothetical protein F4823DRAFT_596483 [Ustulina deusta]|nr:hypothetical protein F4823DRAFT_596483 [Ustulina deusta]
MPQDAVLVSIIPVHFARLIVVCAICPREPGTCNLADLPQNAVCLRLSTRDSQTAGIKPQRLSQCQLGLWNTKPEWYRPTTRCILTLHLATVVNH